MQQLMQRDFPYSAPPKADVHVVWGCHNKALISAVRARGEDLLVMERGYVGDRFVWTSLGWNGLNGNADFCNQAMPSDRFDKHLKKYMSDGWQIRPNGVCLIMGQVTRDAAVTHVNIRSWYADAARKVRELGGSVKFRKHPRETGPAVALPQDFGVGLDKQLAQARCAITFNSNSGVDAVLAGVPTIAIDKGSMVHSLVDHSISLDPSTPNRQQWANDIAYAQWLPQEIEKGEAWEHLRRKFL